MNLSIIEKAEKIAREAHKNQSRKFKDEPYINHPKRVADMAAVYGFNHEQISAAWLHDVLEDCGLEWSDVIRRECGEKVLKLVEELTNPTSLMPDEKIKIMFRKDKFDINFKHLITISKEAKQVKLLDIIDNLSGYENSPKKWLKKFVDEKKIIINSPDFQVDARLINSISNLINKIDIYISGR